MRNAKTEFLSLVEEAGGRKELICAQLSFGYFHSPIERKNIDLKKLFDYQQYKKFLLAIDQTYDDGYGGQELYGTIWFANGKWAERGEYDGSEWWELKSYPEIPVELL